MNCPKCTGLLIREEIQEHSGRFHGLRCIQCGLRLDQIIVQNQHDGNPAGRTAPNGRAAAIPNTSAHRSSTSHSRTSSRSKRPARAS